MNNALWFFDKGKRNSSRGNNVLFIDAHKIYKQIDRAHREFLPEQIEFIANIVRLYRGEAVETAEGSEQLLKEHFPDRQYIDIPGLCRVATLSDIESQSWSLNPGRYTGSAAIEEDSQEFSERLAGLYDDFVRLSDEADILRAKVEATVEGIIQA